MDKYTMRKYNRDGRIIAESKFTFEDLARFSTPSFLDQLHIAGLAGIAYEWEDGTRTVWVKG